MSMYMKKPGFHTIGHVSVATLTSNMDSINLIYVHVVASYWKSKSAGRLTAILLLNFSKRVLISEMAKHQFNVNMKL